MGDRVSSQSARLAELGAEVSSSLENARAERNAMASSGVRDRVRMKIVTRQKSRFSASSSSSSSSTGAHSALPIARIFTVKSVAGSLAIAATIALTAFFATKYRDGGNGDPSLRATRDPVLSFTIGETASNAVKQEGTVGAFIAAPATAETPVTFSDGSKLRLDPAARVRIAEVAKNGARVHVESGSVHMAVVHRDEATKWAVEAGPFEVKVTGTKFDVAWDPASTGLVVKLDEGSVLVHGCGLGEQGRRLTAGEVLKTKCAIDKDPTTIEKRVEENVVAKTPDAVPTASPVVHVAPPPPVVQAPPPALAVPTTKDPHAIVALARRGAHAEALQAAEANGFTSTCDSLQGPELLLLADAARYAGKFDRATEALESTRRRFGGSDASATAAFELGRIEMDIRRELPAAGDHFETYLRERPSGTLAREALGRAIEARHRAGDSARAERLAVRYLGAYPDGPHAKLARKLTSPEAGTRPLEP